MFENRSLRLDLAALALLGLVVFLGFALASYHPADAVGELVRPFDQLYQQDLLVYPPAEQIANACGWWGALLADLLLTSLGIGAYYLVGSLAVVDLLLLTRRRIDAPSLRLLGWIGSLFGLTTITALLLPQLSPGPVHGSGGLLGLFGRGVLEMHFATAGTMIIAISLLVGGSMLCTDYVLFHLLAAVVRHMVRGISAARIRLPAPGSRSQAVAEESRVDTIEPEAARPPETASDDEDEEDEETSADALSVKVRGKAIAEEDAAADDLDDEELEEDPECEDEDELEDEFEEEEEESAEEAPAADARGTAPRPHFRVKKGFDKQEREQVMSTLDEATHQDAGDYELPTSELLIEGDDMCFDEQVKEVRRKAKILETTFANFGFQVKVVEIETGPVIAQYEVELEAGLRLSKITGLADDLAIALRVPSVRIVAPIPGKNTVGIEVPNEVRQVVRLREVIEETNGKTSKMKIPLFLGKDVSGNPLTVDLASLPHLLIAGRTGTGKSVCLNAIISSILMTKKPDEVRMLMIDPKMVELSGYGRLPHLMHPVVTDMRKAEAILAWAVEKMEERYALLARAGVRHITSYNQLSEEELKRRLDPESDEEWKQIPAHLPFIVIVADEMADLMMTAGKEVEQHIIRLAQKSRAVGIHLILATQKPTVDVITGLIKSNLPARIAFQVASRTDSRVVLDEMGAERLLGNGDMLFLWPGTSTLLRGQGTYLTDEEIERVVDAVSTGEQHFVHELVNLKVEQEEGDPAAVGQLKKRDELYEAAIDIVVREGRGSVSLLQRTLGIGYGRAARLIDFMAEDGIVGPYAGSQAREVVISIADWEAMQSGGPASAAAGPPVAPPPPSPKRTNKIKPRSEWEPGTHEPDEEESDLWDETSEADAEYEDEDDGDEHEDEEAEAAYEEDEYEDMDEDECDGELEDEEGYPQAESA